MNYWITLLLVVLTGNVHAQQWQRDHVGVQFQLMVAVGSHRTSVGAKLNAYVSAEYAQLNVGTSWRYHARNLGDRCNFGEWRHSLGLVLMAGKPTNPVNFNWDGPLHQTKRPYSLGYSYLWYRDRVGTSQRSGSWNIGIKRVDILIENDVFAGQAKDRFRTGNTRISYRDSLNSIGVNLVIWTGETRFSVWNKTFTKKSPNGYRDLTPLAYGYKNHGVLYVDAQRKMDYGQIVSFGIGDDSEQVRHIFQNRLIHDIAFIPNAKRYRNTPHYPRLNAAGENVFTRKEKRPDEFYFQVGLNDLFLY